MIYIFNGSGQPPGYKKKPDYTTFVERRVNPELACRFISLMRMTECRHLASGFRGTYLA
jgi:hypothetical protein